MGGIGEDFGRIVGGLREDCEGVYGRIARGLWGGLREDCEGIVGGVWEDLKGLWHHCARMVGVWKGCGRIVGGFDDGLWVEFWRIV